MKKYILVTLIGLVLGILIYYYLKESTNNTSSLSSLEVVLASLCGILVALLCYRISLKLDKVIPWQAQLANRLFAGITIHFLFAFTFISVCIYGYHQLIIDSDILLSNEIFIKLAIILFILMLFYSIIYFAFYSYYTYATLQIATIEQERKQIDLQLKALKSQLSPHFLFNSLNSISSLIFSNTERAETFIRRLAKMYQFTLDSYSEKLIPLEEEINLVNAYSYLMETRFENKFTCQIEIPEEIRDSKIPPLTLQMLVENAIKHNIMSIGNPLTIKISTSGNYIYVKNNTTEVPKNTTSFNIGLSNIHDRYILLHGEGIVIEKEVDFIVKIPIILENKTNDSHNK
ncbi:MAG: histidine kinase [Cellulophaga sp.]